MTHFSFWSALISKTKDLINYVDVIVYGEPCCICILFRSRGGVVLHVTEKAIDIVTARHLRKISDVACKYKAKCSQVINYTEDAFSIQICDTIPDGARQGEPGVKCFKPRPIWSLLPWDSLSCGGGGTTSTSLNAAATSSSLPGAH